MNNLNTFATGDTDYISKLNADNATIKSAIEALEVSAGGAIGISAASVPKGLKYIFDRSGIIGKGSYKPSAGILSAPAYGLTIAAGGFWDGSSLVYQDVAAIISMTGKATGTYYLNVDSSGAPTISTSSGANTLWQLSYSDSTHEVTNVALHSGVAVLFDGADYADTLTSAQLSLTFASLADRLEEIESRLVAMGLYFQNDPATTTGLAFGFKAGKIRNDNLVWETVAGTVTLADASTNYVEVNPADGTVSANTTSFTSAHIPLYEAITAAGAITTVTDKRTWVSAGSGGGGGGHVQNTDTGTTSPTFKLNAAQTGAPSINCELKVERGTSPDVGVRWNEATDKWQFTNDGSTYQDLFDPTAQLAAQEFTKYVGLDDPPKVLEGLARNASSDYETLDLSPYITSPNGLHAVVLRVFFWDSAPGAMVNVMLRAANSAGAPAEAFTIWSNQYGPATMIIPIVNSLAVEYFVQASGTGTANVKVYLAGYMAKVTGVGTVQKQTTQSGISVAASGHTTVNIAGACNRGLAHYLKVTETGGLLTGTYNIELYADDTFTNLIYKAQGMSPTSAYEDYLPFWLRDTDSTSELHVKITNNDGSQTGTFTVEIHYEQFA